jgi:hypothetical protein
VSTGVYALRITPPIVASVKSPSSRNRSRGKLAQDDDRGSVERYSGRGRDHVVVPGSAEQVSEPAEGVFDSGDIAADLGIP